MKMVSLVLAVSHFAAAVCLYGQAPSTPPPVAIVSGADASTGNDTGLGKALAKKDLAAAKAELQRLKDSRPVDRWVLNRFLDVGKTFYEDGVVEQALAWYLVAAEEGHGVAEANVGYLYPVGREVHSRAQGELV